MTGTESPGSADRPAGVRASNSDRDRVATILRAAGTEGLLSLAEMDERLTQAYAATYRHDLDPLLADLPNGGRVLYSHSPESQAQRERFHADFRRGMIRHAAVAAVAVATAVTIWAVAGAGHHFFPGPIIVIAVISLILHARRGRYGWGRYGRGPWGSGPWGSGPWGSGPWDGGPWGRGSWGGPWAQQGYPPAGRGGHPQDADRRADHWA